MGARDAIAKLLSGGIKAFHSSPHDFDKFSLSKIGTGEGAQVYGHGLYFAENPAVSGQGGQYWKNFLHHENLPRAEFNAASYLQRAGFDRDAALKLIEEELAQNAKHPTTNTFADRQKMFLDAKAALESGAPVGPRTYEVNINADPAQMLDWDKRIGQQPPAVQKYFQKQIDQFGPDAAMEAQIKIAGSRAGGLRPVSEGLAQEGIPGIKYLDASSRSRADIIAQAEADAAAGRWYNAPNEVAFEKMKKLPITSNYVVFDPDKIDILKKYGVMGAPAGALGSTYDQSQYEAPPWQ